MSVRAGTKGRLRPAQRAPEGRQRNLRVSLSPLRGSFAWSGLLPQASRPGLLLCRP